MTTETNYDTVFGRMVVERGLCTDEELRRSLEELETQRRIKPVILKDLLVVILLQNLDVLRPVVGNATNRILHVPFRGNTAIIQCL